MKTRDGKAYSRQQNFPAVVTEYTGFLPTFSEPKPSIIFLSLGRAFLVL